MRRRRKRLEIREHPRGSGVFHVGYWDGRTGDPGQDFRSCGSRPSREAAEAFRQDLVRKNPRYS